MALLQIYGGEGVHDPVIAKENGVYYCFSTHGLVRTSPDLCHWVRAPSVFQKNPPWVAHTVPKNKNDIWAPELVYRNGMWRLYYAVSTFGKRRSAIGLAENKTLDAASPDFGWHDRGAVITSTEKSNFNAIDPAVCADCTGQDWFLFGSFWGGLMLLPLLSDGTIPGAEKPLCVATRNTDPNPVEGGFLFLHDDWYYLFVSHDFCCRGTASSYHIVVGRSKSITGPFIDRIGVAMDEGGGTTLRDGFSHERWAGPGHNSIFRDDDGSVYLVYHAYDRLNNGEPVLQIEPLMWQDGWPVVS